MKKRNPEKQRLLEELSIAMKYKNTRRINEISDAIKVMNDGKPFVLKKPKTKNHSSRKQNG
jgi:hypothetical protein